VRAMMESTAVDLLESRRIKELPRVAQALEKTAQLKSPYDNDAFAKFDYLRAIADFHIKLVEAAGNVRLNQLYIAMFPSLARYQAFYTYIPGLMDKSQDEHEHFLNLIKKGNYLKAKALLNSHITKFVGLIADKLNSIENGHFE
jgi:GntR family transcriptional regulator, transcriptional repressor for pyruvate dehydrogenase complex